jgi:hypothetical protein
MMCQRCGSEARNGRNKAHRTERQGEVLICGHCGAVTLTLEGLSVGGGDATLARLAGFGLASRGRPLLEPKREGT